MSPRCYIAGPLFSQQDRELLERLAQHLEQEGITAYLPHRDAGDVGIVSLEDEGQLRRIIFQQDIDAVRAADFLVCLLDGADCDSGTGVEIGIAYEAGKPIFGLKTDLERRGRVVNNMVWGACDQGRTLFGNVERLWRAVHEYLKERSR